MFALITGASEGIGWATAQKLAEEGYNLIIAARNEEKLLRRAEELIEINSEIEVYVHAGNLTDQMKLVELSSLISTEGIDLHILVNNVGQYMEDSVLDESNQLYKSLQINLITPVNLTALLWKDIAENKGHIFNIGSVVSTELRKEAASYTMAKHALRAWNKMLAEELKPKGVKVTGIYPASVYTKSWEDSPVDPSLLIDPEDIATCISNTLKTGYQANTTEIFIETMSGF